MTMQESAANPPLGSLIPAIPPNPEKENET
jgi:hypothetical protein